MIPRNKYFSLLMISLIILTAFMGLIKTTGDYKKKEYVGIILNSIAFGFGAYILLSLYFNYLSKVKFLSISEKMMCINKKCKSRNKCDRYIRKENVYRWNDFDIIYENCMFEEERCKYFKNKKERRE